MSDRVKFCVKCKEYIDVIPDDPKNQKDVQNFSNDHRGHNLVIIEKNDLLIYKKKEEKKEE